MPKPFVAKIVSANGLLDGRVVYLAPDGSWTRDHRAAHVARDAPAAAALLEQGQTSAGVAVGASLVDVDVDGGGAPEPRRLREVVRVRGPSVGPGAGGGWDP